MTLAGGRVRAGEIGNTIRRRRSCGGCGKVEGGKLDWPYVPQWAMKLVVADLLDRAKNQVENA
jgi:hypothetical protein